MPSEYKTKQYYKLRREWKEIKSEYNDLKLLFDYICVEFVRSITSFCDDNNLGDPFSETEELTQNVGGLTTSSSKSFFRKIVMNTHPDKALKNSKKTKKIYTQATNAKKSGNLQELLDVGRETSLSPDINAMSLEDLKILESNINEIKDKILKIKNSYAWNWFHANPNKRNEIFYNFIDAHSK